MRSWAACSPPHSRRRPAPPSSHHDACGGGTHMWAPCGRVSIKWGCDCGYLGKWEEGGGRACIAFCYTSGRWDLLYFILYHDAAKKPQMRKGGLWRCVLKCREGVGRRICAVGAEGRTIVLLFHLLYIFQRTRGI